MAMKREVLTKTIIDTTPEGIDKQLKDFKTKNKVIATQTHAFKMEKGIQFVYILFYEEWE